MQINQVNISYLPAEDRLLMRINTSDTAEFRLWLTRAVVARMLTGLSQSQELLMGSKARKTANPLLHRAIEQFDREASATEPVIMTQFEATASRYPLGQEPLLVVRLDVTTKTDHVSFAFLLSSNQLLTINLTSGMVASITRLLHEALRNVDWNLPYFTMKRPIISLPPSETIH